MIDTREELVNALSEAAELEHGLLAQYLFAAFSLKRRTDEGITSVQQARLVDWERDVLAVAHQEMYHLASVCNLLSAIGAAPQFLRPNFPQPAKAYYPFDFQLERFGDSALYRFIVFELPDGEPLPTPPVARLELDSTRFALAPDPLIYSCIGELYRQIAAGFDAIPEDELFIGPKPFQDVEDWGLRLKLHVVRDRATAHSAIKFIVEEGEGAPGKRQGSHYDRFIKIRQSLSDEQKADPVFDPARRVALNPQTRAHRDTAGQGTLITHEVTREVAELFNDVYSTLLLMLIQYYGYGGETTLQREMLRDSSRRLMSATVRPLGEVLTELPALADSADVVAGPGFEIYSALRLAPDVGTRWVVLRERLQQALSDSAGLAQESKHFPVLARLDRVAFALKGTLLNLASIFEGEA
jgi:hypothetical protein